jgi:PAS domain S-box-containing protein
MNKEDDIPDSREELLKNIKDLNKKISVLESQAFMHEKYEKELMDKQEANRAILEDLPDFICRFRPDGTITYGNTAYCNYAKKTCDEILETSVFSYIPREDRKQLKKYLDSLSVDCPVRRIDYRWVTPDGNIRWQQWTLRALFDEKKKVIEYLSAGRDITNLKYVEDGLIDALEKYSTIFESSNDAIMLQEGDCIIDCNTAALNIFRYRMKDQLINKHYIDFSSKIQADGEISEVTAQKHIKRALKRGIERFQWVCKRSDGTHFPADVILSPLTLEGKRIIAAVIRDISEQKQTEEALRMSEEKFRDLVENINDVIFSLDKDGTVTYTSPAIKKILGYKFDELVGKNFTEIVYPEDLNDIINRYYELLSGKLMPFEYRLIKKNGKPCWVRTYSKPIMEGNKLKIFGLITDISKRKRAEDDLKRAYASLEEMVKERTMELSETNKNLRKEIRDRRKAQDQVRRNEEEYMLIAKELNIVLHGITDLIVLCDKDMKIVWANKAAAESIGKTPDELKGKHCNELWHNRNIAPEDCPIWNTLESGRENENIQKTPDGSIWEVRAYPLLDEHGTIRGAIEITRNVTESKILEEEMQKRQKLESLGTLAGGIAHDFNNILTVILGNISFAKMLLNTDDKVYTRLNDVENASLKAKDLTSQLLTFSKGGSPLKKIIHLDRLLHDTAILALQYAEVKPEFSFPKDLWQVEVDESQIAQVVNNIINNAEQAMPQGGVITISSENIELENQKHIPMPSGKYVKVSITDTGQGIQKEHIQNIFDPFFTTKKQGYGLGLATSYSIIKKHGGYITADSRIGKGTTIVMYLPASSGQQSSSKNEFEEMYMGKGNILFMDDEDFIRDLAENILTHLGYKVTFARNGQEALEEYKKAREKGTAFDAVILDLTIPGGMGGKDCIKKLKKMDPDVKAIVSSGYSDDPVVTNPQKYGFRAYIAKPYKIQTLSTVLNKTITES